MTWIIDTTSKRRLPARFATGLAISAVLALGTFAALANARDDDGRWNGGYYNGGYYNAPPVVYGSPYGASYYGYAPYANPPPVIYGPGVGISLPFVNLNIR
jgi:hypothetical protein